MATEGDDLVSRIVKVENDMRRVKGEAAAALALARSGDEDVSIMNERHSGQTRVLNALRETQLEHGELLREHGRRLDRLEWKFDGLERKVDEGFARVDANFRQIDANFRQIDANFRQVEEKFAVVNAGLAHITALLTRDEERGERT